MPGPMDGLGSSHLFTYPSTIIQHATGTTILNSQPGHISGRRAARSTLRVGGLLGPLPLG
eukprot:2647560-Prymnesium_polylepis.1